jgi:hypothetical protein
MEGKEILKENSVPLGQLMKKSLTSRSYDLQAAIHYIPQFYPV